MKQCAVVMVMALVLPCSLAWAVPTEAGLGLVISERFVPGLPVLEVGILECRAPNGACRTIDPVDASGQRSNLIGLRLIRPLSAAPFRRLYFDLGVAFAETRSAVEMIDYRSDLVPVHVGAQHYLREWGPYVGGGLCAAHLQLGLRYYRGYADGMSEVYAFADDRSPPDEYAALQYIFTRSTFALEVGYEWWGCCRIVAEGIRTSGSTASNRRGIDPGPVTAIFVVAGEHEYRANVISETPGTSLVTYALRFEVDVAALFAK